MWRWRQRLEWSFYKTRNPKDCQQTTRSWGEAWSWSCPHSSKEEPTLPALDGGLVASRTVRPYVLLFKPLYLCVFGTTATENQFRSLSWQPSKPGSTPLEWHTVTWHADKVWHLTEDAWSLGSGQHGPACVFGAVPFGVAALQFCETHRANHTHCLVSPRAGTGHRQLLSHQSPGLEPAQKLTRQGLDAAGRHLRRCCNARGGGAWRKQMARGICHWDFPYSWRLRDSRYRIFFY